MIKDSSFGKSDLIFPMRKKCDCFKPVKNHHWFCDECWGDRKRLEDHGNPWGMIQNLKRRRLRMYGMIPAWLLDLERKKLEAKAKKKIKRDHSRQALKNNILELNRDGSYATALGEDVTTKPADSRGAQLPGPTPEVKV